MVVTLTVQSKNYKDAATSYSMGFEGSKIVNYFTKPTADTGYTATSVVVYNTEDGVQDVFGVSQSIATIANAVAAPSQLEIDNIETAVGLAVDGTYSAPVGSNFLDATTTTIGAAVALDTKLGANATPVVRTNNPIVGASTTHANIDKLDAAIGADADLTVLTRTKGQVVLDSTVMAKVDALDAAIGADADLTPVTRTVGQVVVDSTVMTKVEALDTAIGFDAQLAGTPKNISNASSIYQNLDALDTYKTVRTVKKTIGGVGVAGCDYNFTTAADMNEQVITLANIVPAKARVIDVMSFTDTTFTGATTLVADFGSTSGGNEYIASATVYAANAIQAIAAGAQNIALPLAAASNLYVNATPGANWSNVTAGKMSVYVTFIDLLNV